MTQLLEFDDVRRAALDVARLRFERGCLPFEAGHGVAAFGDGGVE